MGDPPLNMKRLTLMVNLILRQLTSTLDFWSLGDV